MGGTAEAQQRESACHDWRIKPRQLPRRGHTIERAGQHGSWHGPGTPRSVTTELGGLLPNSYPATNLQKWTLVLLAPEHDVCREICGAGFYYAVAEGRKIQAL